MDRGWRHYTRRRQLGRPGRPARGAATWWRTDPPCLEGAGETLGKAGYHVVAFDARGHGYSDWAPSDAYGVDYMVKDLCCIVEAVGG